MNQWMLLVTNVAIGSLIGGLTNELAIRMLFRPHRPWRFGRFRVPFTPGLIPRRRAEIAVQMGRLVEEHLFTEEGIRRSLREGRLEESLRGWLNETFRRWTEREETWREWLQSAAPGLLEADGGWSERLREPLREKWRSLVWAGLERAAGMQVRELIGPELQEKWDEWLAPLARRLVDRLREHLRSPEGQTQVRGLLRHLPGSGGMLAGFVGMFLSDEKVTARLLAYADELLARPELSDRLGDLIRREAEALLAMRVGDLADRLGRDRLDAWCDRLFTLLAAEGARWLDQPVGAALRRMEKPIREEWIPRLARRLVLVLEQNVQRLFSSLSVAAIVTRQVEEFPLEQVEAMIVGITGKEFRMITLLGFVLGGVIGLVQGLLQRFV